MDVTYYRYEEHTGLPPDGESGQFFGFDGPGNVYVLRWNPARLCWGGVGFDPKHRDRAFVFLTTAEMDSFIVRWAPAPLVWADIEPGQCATKSDAFLNSERVVE